MDPTLIAAAIVTVLAALTGAAVTIINAAAAARDRKDAYHDREIIRISTTATEAKADTIIEKAAEIHTLADGNLSKVTASLAVANEKIMGLEKLMAELSKESRRANGSTVVAVDKLQQVERDTTSIKGSTENIEAAVQRIEEHGGKA